jgi:eukaryotic-like serine/threonine-protein kinase
MYFSGAPLFARELGAAIYSFPLVHEDTICIASLDKCVYAINCTDWKDRWVYETSERIFASPTIEQGSLWNGSNDGRLHELDPETGKLKSLFTTTERIVNAITVAKERLFVSTVANEIYCLTRKNPWPLDEKPGNV